MRYSKTILVACASLTLFIACQKNESCDGTITQTFNTDNFTSIKGGSIMHFTITKGTSFSVQADGCRRDVEDLRVRVRPGGELEIDFDRQMRRRDDVYLDITLPQLTGVDLSGAADAHVSGFANDNNMLRVKLSGASQITLDGTTAQTQVDLSGASDLTLNGTTQKLYGNLSGASELQAFSALANEVDIEVSGGSEAYITVQDKLTAKASGGSKVVYKGNPATKDLSTSGGATITQQ